MIKIYPEQLACQLQETLRPCYLLSGNEPLLLQESQDAIRAAAQQQQFSEHFSFTSDTSTDWEEIFSICQARSLFASRQTLLLILPENGPSSTTAEQLVKLVSQLHSDILLLLRCGKITRAQENSVWFNALSDNAVLVSCLTPERKRLPRWLSERAKGMKLTLDDAASQLICYSYEGNLLALSQALQRLSLLWPDGNLTLPRVEQAVHDAAHFTAFHWVDALLAGKSKRALHILRQMRAEGSELPVMLRTLQRELILLLTLQRQMENKPLRALFDQYRVWQNRRPLISDGLQRMKAGQLRRAICLLTQIETALKKDYSQSLWSEMETLSLLLCHPAFPDNFCDV